MGKGLSNLIISLTMLAIVVPIGVVLIERSRDALKTQPPVEVPTMLRVYAIANGSTWFLVMVNHGGVDTLVASLILSDGSSAGLGVIVPARSTRALDLSLSPKPLYVIVNTSPGVVFVEVIG